MESTTSERVPHARVLAALETAKVPYAVHRHSDCLLPIRTPHDFARCMARPVDAVVKSLFLATGASEPERRFGVAVCPVIGKVDFGILFLSTPERNLVRGWYDYGPPENVCHIREWNAKEFRRYVAAHFEIISHQITHVEDATQLLICKKKLP